MLAQRMKKAGIPKRMSWREARTCTFEEVEHMVTLFTIIMLISSALVIFGCLEQHKIPNSMIEWVILIVTAFLIVNNVR